MEYKVVPFVASIDPKKGTVNQVAEQLETLMKIYSEQGWKYHDLESVKIYVKPDAGCFGLGARPGFTTINYMAVFTR